MFLNFNQSYQGTKIQSDNYQKINEHPETDPKTECQEIQAMISEITDFLIIIIVLIIPLKRYT